jgi:peptidoglycan-associated lipoprotein
MKFKIVSAVVVVGGIALLAACSHEPLKVEPAAEATQPPAEPARTEVALQETRVTAVETAPTVEPVVLDSIYFDFDSAILRNDAQTTLLSDREYIQPDAALKIRVEGNCDERGSREYNLALGDRRAQSVKGRLVMLGVPESQLETVSYGKEKPRALGHSEAAWAQNRRVDFAVQANSQQ